MKIKSVIALCLVLCILLPGCLFRIPRKEKINPETDGIVMLQTGDMYSPVIHYYENGEEEETEEVIHRETKYYIIASNRRSARCDSFTPDEMKKYKIPVDSFKYSGKNNINTEYILKDENNKICELTDVTRDIYEEVVETFEHDCFKVEIFQIDDEYFVYAELNVNLWSPCCLYYYNQTAKKLIELYTFDDEGINGIHIISKERLHSLGMKK